MDERQSDTEETFGQQEVPGEVSNQNTEEPSTPSGGQGTGSGQGHRGGEGSAGAGHERAGREGGAGEDSQATGSPDSAG